MHFIHIADAHLGGWRSPQLRDANNRSFGCVIEQCITQRIDFLLIAGDFFNTAFPSIDTLHFAVAELIKLKSVNIPVYIIPGSHDFSPSGKTMLDVLERAGLFTNVMHHAKTNEGRIELQFVVDRKTGAKITGMFGKKGGLDRELYGLINRKELEEEPGYKIFMFHCTIGEMKPGDMAGADSVPISLLPSNFSYYAGGHVHIIENKNILSYKNVVYPGPVFPNNFAELEKLSCGSYVDVVDGVAEHKKIDLHPLVKIEADAKGLSPEEVVALVNQKARSEEVSNAIVLVRAFGTLASGKIIDVNLSPLANELSNRGAYAVIRNTNLLESKESENTSTKAGSIEEIEERILAEGTGKQNWVSKENEIVLAKELMSVYSREQEEGEKVYDYDARIISDANVIAKRVGR